MRQEKIRKTFQGEEIFKLGLTESTEAVQTKKWSYECIEFPVTWLLKALIPEQTYGKLQSACITLKSKMITTTSFLISLPDTEKCSLIYIYRENKFPPTRNKSMFHGSIHNWDAWVFVLFCFVFYPILRSYCLFP